MQEVEDDLLDEGFFAVGVVWEGVAPLFAKAL
jgi:hypothetical protein